MTLLLDDLLSRVSAALRDLPGAVELYLFGSAADPAREDVYSDLDLQVISADYALSRAAWPWILNRVGAMELVYPIQEQPLESAFCIAFENESLFHKVDIGLCDQRNDLGFINQVDHKVLLWQQLAKRDPVSTAPGNVTMPDKGTAAYFLIGELLSSVRYVKARKRGQHLTCWRFLSSKFNALLRCYTWNGDLWNFPASPLTTWDYTALDRNMPECERLGLLEGLKIQSPDEMDRALIDITRRIAERICPKYAADESQSSLMVCKYIHFIEQELLGSRLG